MSDYLIESVNGSGDKRNGGIDPLISSEVLFRQDCRPAVAPEIQEKPCAPAGDSVHFSDDVFDDEVSGEHSIEGLRFEINNLKGSFSSGFSGVDSTSRLKGDVDRLETEKAGSLNSAGIGLTPGINRGETYSSRRSAEGKPEIKQGLSLSSRRSRLPGYEPGGGMASAGMIKLETDYAHSIKSGHTIKPDVEDGILQAMADRGKSAGPIKALLGE